MKRALDFAAALAGLIVTAPVIAICVLLIRRNSPGPGIFSQVRVGRHGRHFTCYKLRTMGQDTPNVASHEASAAQVTSIGRILRRTKLDELPQLWNVLRGEMSLVGPRPCLPSQEVLVREREKRGVLTIRPGITGLAQVRGIDMSDPVRLAEVDAAYLREASTLFDLKLIIRTVLGRGRGDAIG